MSNWDDVQTEVVVRADSRCEYCGMHQSLQGATFHVEHVVPRSRGGSSELHNLALACPSCNLHKSDRIDATDPETDQLISLFHPRLQEWDDHFEWSGHQIVGLTQVGRTTLAALDLNHPRRVRIREAERLFDLFPPKM